MIRKRGKRISSQELAKKSQTSYHPKLKYDKFNVYMLRRRKWPKPDFPQIKFSAKDVWSTSWDPYCIFITLIAYSLEPDMY